MTSTRIEWVAGHCQLLQSISAEFKDTQPFRGLTIGTGIHLEAKTVALLLTLRDGGARVVSTGNLNTTQPEAVDALKAQGVAVIGGPTRDRAVHDSYLDGIIAARPDLILDNGGDLFAKYLDAPYEGLRGGTEETTSGRMRLEPLRARLELPILVINDSPIKQFAENEHAVGQSALESYLRLTNRVTNGENVTVFGYGACGRGVAANFRGACARVTVAEVNPVTRLQAHLDGFSTPPRAEAIASADLIITVTGARNVVTAADLPLLRDGVILANAGHFPWEIDVDGLLSAPDVAGTREYADDLMTLELKDGRRIHIISRGHMFNLAGPRPLGNSIESMDLGFALQARCLEAVATGAVAASSCVVPVPAYIDAAVASSYLDRKYARLGSPGRVHVPVVEPGLPLVGGEGLLPVGRSGRDVRPPEPGEYGHIVVGVVAEELADSVLECSDYRREQRARPLAGPVQRPLAGVRVVQPEGQPGEPLGRENDLVKVRAVPAPLAACWRARR